MKIKITKNGPYIVTGGVPLFEKRIALEGGVYRLKEGRPLPQAETYALCRCGRSKNSPFCDGSHAYCGFDGAETADRRPYIERAERLEGPGLDMLDDHRCAFARFCHRHGWDAWELVERSHDPDKREEAIRAASECPAGRLTAVTKEGGFIEPELEPGIDVLYDEGQKVPAGLYVRGGVALEAEDGTLYERRNRCVLCRCGKSSDKPFCDGSHVPGR